MLSRAPLKAKSSEIVECLRRIDLADADIQLERVLSYQVARLADQDGRQGVPFVPHVQQADAAAHVHGVVLPYVR